MFVSMDSKFKVFVCESRTFKSIILSDSKCAISKDSKNYYIDKLDSEGKHNY